MHTIKLAISDVGDTILDSAVFLRAFNAVAPDPRTVIGGIVNTGQGDTNLRREQGQIVIHSNTISNSANYGIRVDAGARSPEGDAVPGSVRVTRNVNDLNLVPGVVISNNVVANNINGGIFFSGDTNAGSLADAPVPFGRIVNNTVVGSGIGIRVQDNASPTLLNNIVADTNVGISIDGTSSCTVMGGTLYAGVGTTSSNGNDGSFPLYMVSSANLFVNANFGNFYLTPDALAIDSSVESLNDRSAMKKIRQPLGIADSPIIAPDYDLYGQLRVDDPNVSSESGVGENVFKDRGAIDRSDFSGPSAQLINPRDNDSAGKDRDLRVTYVETAGGSQFDFSIQLLDGVSPSDQANGSGPDARTVTAEAIVVRKDNVPLEEGVDYRFGYDSTSGIIRLTPLAGIWEPNYTYEIELLNVDQLVLSARAGNLVVDGQTFVVTDDTLTSATFEYDSGYNLHVPANGGAAFIDGETFTITQGLVTTTFEFDSNGVKFGTNVPVTFTPASTQDDVAGALAAAIRGAGIGLNATSWSGGFVHVGGTATTVISTVSSALTDSGQPGVAIGNVAVPFVEHPAFTANAMATSIANAVSASTLSVTVEARGDEVVLIGASTASGIVARNVSALRDLAGNAINTNRFNGTTAFTVSLGTGRDYGDAPSQYPVLKVDGGASHQIREGFRLGNTIFSTADGEPSDNADSDIGDDGVSFTNLVAGYTASVLVNAAGVTAENPGFLDGWIDFNGDGDWNDTGEQILDSVPVATGINSFNYLVPSTAIVGSTFARFRLSGTGNLSPAGAAGDGEVEDYKVSIGGNPWHNYANAFDTNGDTFVSPVDALLIIYLINNAADFGVNLADPLPVPPLPTFAPPPYYDVDGDGYVAPRDVLQVIAYLNSGAGEGEGEWDAEGEAGSGLASTLSTGLLDDGLRNDTLVGGALLAAANSATARETTVSTSAATSVAAPVQTPQWTLAANQVDPHALAIRTNYQSEDLEDLLDELSSEMAEDQEARDSLFGSWDV